MNTDRRDDPAASPVFIGGCDRSGTTLLGSLLGGHAACITTPESPFKTEVFAAFARRGGPPSGAEALAAIRDHWRFRIWNLDLAGIGEADDYASALLRVVAHHAEREGRPASARWIDHTPNNVRHASLLSRLFPAARFVHIVRDGRAVAASVLPLDWGPNTIPYAAPWWVERVAYGLAAESWLGRERILRVRYEDLVGDPASEVTRILAFLDLPFEAAAVEGHGFEAPSYTSAQHGLVGGGVDASRITSFRNRLTDREIELFEAETKDFLAYLGYEPDYGAAATPSSRAERIRAMATEVARRRVNRFRQRRRRAAAEDSR